MMAAGVSEAGLDAPTCWPALYMASAGATPLAGLRAMGSAV
jgi:hypothetical protein